MSQNLTRRSLISAAPAAVVAATLPALAAEHADATLLALRERYERTLAIMDAVSPMHARAETAYFALKTEHPDLDRQALRKASGLISTERAWTRSVSANSAVINEITEQPAHTLAGLIFKAKVSKKADNFDPDLLASIIEDLTAMEGAA